MLARELGIDLGSTNTAVVVKRRGIIAREPSVVAVDRRTRQVVAVGTEARRMIGRTPDAIQPILPVRGGAISDPDRTTALLRHMLRQIGHSRFLKPRVVLAAQTGITEVDRRALLDAAIQAGAGEVLLVDEAVAAALGAGLPVTEPVGSLVMDIGGGTTDAAVISLGAVVIAQSAPAAGDMMDEAVARHVRREHGLIIGEPTAERVKIAVGSALAPSPQTVAIAGRQVATGLPTTLHVTAAEIHEALKETLLQIDALLLSLLERTPPELMADISRAGITLTGGGAQLAGLAERLSRLTGMPVHLIDSPADAVAIGTSLVLENQKRLRLVRARR